MLLIDRNVDMGITENEGLLYEVTLDALMLRLKSEDCTAADINAARAFIKDQGIQGGKTMAPKEDQLAFEMPKFTEVGKEIEEDDGRTGTNG
jgi:hypothetical protein